MSILGWTSASEKAETLRQVIYPSVELVLTRLRSRDPSRGVTHTAQSHRSRHWDPLGDRNASRGGAKRRRVHSPS